MARSSQNAKPPAAAKALNVGEVQRVDVIGCGGTGSILAEHLARLICGFRLPVALGLWDGDEVEEANVARQNYLPCEIGANKAYALGLRLSGQLGLPITCQRRHFTKADANAAGTGLVITCVDTLTARKEIALGLPRNHLWLDVGNERTSGQAILGTSDHRGQLEEQYRLWNDRPYVHLLPDIAACNERLMSVRREKKTPSCADEPFRLQGFGVNAMAALAAASIARAVLVDRRVTVAQIWFDVAAGRMLPRMITRELFEPWAGKKNCGLRISDCGLKKGGGR